MTAVTHSNVHAAVDAVADDIAHTRDDYAGLITDGEKRTVTVVAPEWSIADAEQLLASLNATEPRWSGFTDGQVRWVSASALRWGAYVDVVIEIRPEIRPEPVASNETDPSNEGAHR